LDDDDALDPKFLETMVLALDNLSGEYGGVGCARFVIYPESRIYTPLRIANQSYVSIDDGFLLRKSVFSKITYDENLRWSEDADFGIEFAKHFKIQIIDKPLLLKYGHKIEAAAAENYFSFSFPSKKTLVDMRKYVNKRLPFFFERGDKKEIAYLCRLAGRNYCWGGHPSEGIPFLWRAFITRPSLRNFLNLLFSLGGSKIYRCYLALETDFIRFVRSNLLNRPPAAF